MTASTEIAADTIAALRVELDQDAVLSGNDISERYSVDFTGENEQMPSAVVRRSGG